ncbi:hypothetical protein HX777_02250 [Pseudomonas agarici]|nr:hypothetical protein [Pseudomonas agarici]
MIPVIASDGASGYIWPTLACLRWHLTKIRLANCAKTQIRKEKLQIHGNIWYKTCHRSECHLMT